MQASFTTMLPNINGIIELCGLLFAPSYQIRHVEDLSIREQRKRKAEGFSPLSNIGALFGCGGFKVKKTNERKSEFVSSEISMPVTKLAFQKSILPDHDVDRPFSVEIDDEDIELVREIRDMFNNFLGIFLRNKYLFIQF